MRTVGGAFLIIFGFLFLFGVGLNGMGHKPEPVGIVVIGLMASAFIIPGLRLLRRKKKKESDPEQTASMSLYRIIERLIFGVLGLGIGSIFFFGGLGGISSLTYEPNPSQDIGFVIFVGLISSGFIIFGIRRLDSAIRELFRLRESPNRPPHEKRGL